LDNISQFSFILVEIFGLTVSFILYYTTFKSHQKSSKNVEIFVMSMFLVSVFGFLAIYIDNYTLFISVGNFLASLLALFHFKKEKVISSSNFLKYLLSVSIVSIPFAYLDIGADILYLNTLSSTIFILISINLFNLFVKVRNPNIMLFAITYFIFGVHSLVFYYIDGYHISKFLTYLVLFYILLRNLNETDSQKKELTNFYQEYKRAIEHGSIVSKTDKNGLITYINEGFIEISGYSENELIGRSHSILKDSETRADIYNDLWKTISNGQIWKGTLRNVSKTGEYFHVRIVIVPIFNKSGCISEYIAYREDITELVNSQRELKDIHNRDSLTNLGNRYKLFSDLVLKGDTLLALVNIDSFKEVNDFYGEEMGDEIIRETGEFIQRKVGRYKFRVYRVQADEFAIIPSQFFPDIAKFRAIIVNIIEDIKTYKFALGNFEIFVNVSAGISSGKGKKVFKKADIALKTAKKNKVDILNYSPDLKIEEIYESNLIWTRKIKLAIAEDRIVPYFQPIYDLKEGRATKFEVLMRLITKDGRVISPFSFLDIAKKSKLYFQLTTIIFDKVVKEMQRHPNYEFSMNLSSEDIMNTSFIYYIKKEVKKLDIGSRLIFEIVESEGIENFEEVDEFISWAKNAGVRIAIDDFGTGYSNFNYLIKLEADFVKIDGSMIKNIDTDKNSRAVVEAILQFTKRTEMKVVAEFVASRNIFTIIDELNIDFAQGYFIDMPRASIDEINKTINI
jgi:PAS domain S-box-containing protein/diguanylate cyclase (GGDEF)-like protein